MEHAPDPTPPLTPLEEIGPSIYESPDKRNFVLQGSAFQEAAEEGGRRIEPPPNEQLIELSEKDFLAMIGAFLKRHPDT
ncbi:MAG TPA: hypothetical protein VJ836_07485 [Candidatus Saccharimonadales bacterium]|nr:hypothetical protein [Candidatus Saccharimonadales bacterium]